MDTQDKKKLSKLHFKSMKLESMGVLKGGVTFTFLEPTGTEATCEGGNFLEDEHYILSELDTEYLDV